MTAKPAMREEARRTAPRTADIAVPAAISTDPEATPTEVPKTLRPRTPTLFARSNRDGFWGGRESWMVDGMGSLSSRSRGIMGAVGVRKV